MPEITKIFKKVAPKIGARLILEPKWGYVGQIVFKSGRKRYFRFSSLDINTLGASEVARDKDFANFFMRRMGYPMIEGRPFFREEWAIAINSKENISAAYRYATRLGFPVIIKPNSGSQGRAVRLVHTKREFYEGMADIFAIDRVALVQRPVRGKDYRIVVLDKEVISAYERVPLNVCGDSRSTIRALLQTKQRKFKASQRDTTIKFDDPRIKAKLATQGLRFSSIPKRGEKIFLLDNANLSTGGESVDVTQSVHPSFKKIAVSLTRDMGLRLCGVDLIIDGSISEKSAKYWVVEINSAPGLDHYARSGAAQHKIVEEMYAKVLVSLDRD